ncbi:glycosyltransferase family 4 protein [Methanobrevibacter filiformis]|nr:glycosyltransferase family 4 protein [Methanobrevibacter filiformis]
MSTFDIIVLFLIAFVVTVFFTYFIRNMLNNANLVDSPIVTEHKHKKGTPTMGGIAFLFSVFLICSLYIKNDFITITSLIMASAGLVGLIDDLVGLKIKEVQKHVENISSIPIKLGQLTLKPGEKARAATEKAKSQVKDLVIGNKLKIIDEIPIKTEIGEMEKIVTQVVIAIFLILTGAVTTLGGFSLGLLAIPVVIIAIIGAINSVNLIDGMDGLAAGIIAIASIACGVFLYLHGNLEGILPFALLAGISLGFLVFNKYPASVFMGDIGSFALGAGYATAVLITNTPYFGVLALAVPIVSVIISLIHRAKIIRLPVEPLHHTLNYKGLSEKQIIVSYWFLTFLVSAIGILVSFYYF